MKTDRSLVRRLAKVKSLAGDRAHLVHTINYKTHPEWEKEVAKIIPTGVHFVVEVGGSGTIERSFQSLVSEARSFRRRSLMSCFFFKSDRLSEE